jgi:hypothetical protein
MTSSLKKKVLFTAMFELSQIGSKRMITKDDITKIAKLNGLSISETDELKSLYLEMYKITPKGNDEISEKERLEIISKILYPGKNFNEKTNLEKAVEESKRISTELLQLRKTHKRISLRYNLNIEQEIKLTEEIEKIIEERKEELIDIESFCEEVIHYFLNSPEEINSFIEKSAKEKNIKKEELKSLLIKQLVQLKN